MTSETSDEYRLENLKRVQSKGLPEPQTFTAMLKQMFEVAGAKGLVTNITCGNCGSFALALKKFFGEGNLVTIGGYAHVLLEKDGLFYDGVGCRDFEELAESDIWGEYLRPAYMEGETDNDALETEQDKDIEKGIPKHTKYYEPYQTFEELLMETFTVGAERKKLYKTGAKIEYVGYCPECSHKTIFFDVNWNKSRGGSYRCSACAWSGTWGRFKPTNQMKEKYEQSSATDKKKISHPWLFTEGVKSTDWISEVLEIPKSNYNYSKRNLRKCPECHEQTLAYNEFDDFYYCESCDFETDDLENYNAI